MRGGVHPKLGKAIYDEEGNFVRVEITPVTEEEIKAAEEFTRHRVGDLLKKASPSRAEQRAHHAFQWEGILRSELARPGISKEREADLTFKLSRALRDQGRIEEALGLLPNDAKLRAGHRALTRDDGEFCECPVKKKFVKKFGHEQPYHSFRCFDVYYPGKPRHKMWICGDCGNMNISNKKPPQVEKVEG